MMHELLQQRCYHDILTMFPGAMSPKEVPTRCVKGNPRKINELRMDTLAMRSPAALSRANIQAHSAIYGEHCWDPIRYMLRDFTGDAEGRYHHFTCRDVLPEEDSPLTHCYCW